MYNYSVEKQFLIYGLRKGGKLSLVCLKLLQCDFPAQVATLPRGAMWGMPSNLHLVGVL